MLLVFLFCLCQFLLVRVSLSDFFVILSGFWMGSGFWFLFVLIGAGLLLFWWGFGSDIFRRRV